MLSFIFFFYMCCMKFKFFTADCLVQHAWQVALHQENLLVWLACLPTQSLTSGTSIACCVCFVKFSADSHQVAVLCSNFQRLSPNVQKRLAVENDDKATQWSITDLLPLHKKIGQ